MSSTEAAHQGHDDEHHLHLPHGSWTPFFLANAIALVGLSLIFPLLIVPSLLFLVIVVLFWVKEDYEWWKEDIGTGPGMAMSGLKLFISSEVFIFGALFATYFTFMNQADHWPDGEVHLPVLKTFIFSLFLFASSGTIHIAEKKLHEGDKRGFNIWWGITILLGAIFLYGQVDEYLTLISEGQVLGANQFITSFYMITGTHGLHVFGGAIFLLIVWVRSLKGQYDQDRHVGPSTSALYWHFVDLVWVFVFGMLYVVPYFQGAFSGGH